MSSSMFIERSAEVESSDSNLVVVYGKNGINFDKRSLQKIIEEKTISTISVVRLTSPTPSMKDEEEAERLAELAAPSDDSDIESDAIDGSDNDENSKSEKDHITGDDNENSEDEHDDFEDEDETPKVKKRPGRKPKIVKKQKKRRKPKDRPEIAGLTVEHFYTDDIANELVKSALKVAGVPIFRRTAETDALLEGIRNDHNYTPYTSPEQMRAQKAAERLEAEQRAAQQRKLLPHISSNGKQQSSKKKLQLQQTTQQNPLHTPAKEKTKVPLDDQISAVPKSTRVLHNSKDDDELIEDSEDFNSSTIAENNDFTEGDNTNDESEISGDSRLTDNDRESDIDFNVNNRHQAKRKRSKKLKKNAPSRIHQQQHLNQALQRQPQQVTVRNKQIQEQTADNIQTLSVKPATLTPTVVRASRVTAPPIVTFMPLNKPGHSPAAMLNKQLSTFNISTASPTSPSTSAAVVRRTPIVQVGGPPAQGSPTTSNTLNFASNSTHLLASPQEVKEIVINKNLNSPKGVFTNLNTLLNENTKTLIPTSKAKKTPSIPLINPTTVPTVKGFMPIGIDTASSNQLPAQISIQTHQSSSELAAENERQLDLIDSIVQDEMQKSSLIEQESTSADENIPKLVKMLESTAEVLDQQNLKMPTKESTNEMEEFGGNISLNDTAAVDSIDIANTPLLDTPDDDITADFLQHVVGLIEEDKQFKEVVEKEVIRVSFNNEASIVNADALLPSHTTDHSANILPKIIEQSEKTNTDMKPNQFDPQNLQATSNIDTIVSHESTRMPTSTPILARTVSNAQIEVRCSEPIQIVRGNGRVITLPPIEAPTTRAKRRAQVNTASTPGDVTNSVVLSESSLDGSVYSNASYAGNESNSLQQLSCTKKPEESSNRRPISSKDDALNTTPTTTRTSRNRNKAIKKLPSTSQAIDTEASETQDDDDDPKKLWCVCRQPHNNRFMICCDVCEDWFHGTCVNITKAMGRAMELKGTDWTCPNCKQKQEEKKQPRITDMLQSQQISTLAITSDVTVMSTDKQPRFTSADQLLNYVKSSNAQGVNTTQTQRIQSESDGTKKTNQQVKLMPASIPVKKMESNLLIQKSQLTPLKVQSKPLHQQQLKFYKIECSPNSHVPCIVCKQHSKQNSLYCSDECIRKYANNAVQMQQSSKIPSSGIVTNFSGEIKKGKKKDLFEDMLLLADSVKKVERINVFDRKTGRVIFGQQAPTAQNLKKWLQDNPTFEVVQPGSNEAVEIEKRLSKRVAPSTSPTVSKSIKSPVFRNSQQSSEMHYSQPVLTSKAECQDGEISSPQPIKAHLQQQPQTISTKAFYQENQVDTKIREKPPKQDRISNIKKNHETSNTTQKPEPIRLNVRRTLKEQLLLRIRESEKSENKNIDSELSTEDVETFAKNVESEMYNLFGKDTGTKYRAKYRSLMFNIKDRKNETLFTKICAKQIVPKQLVRMTPEELASQELAKWRENENKHQLEMIKKSELDLLSCTKNYVLKTHKGEEVIESKSTDCVNLDLTIPVEDVVSVLNNSCVIYNETLDQSSFLIHDMDDGKNAKEITEESKNKEYKPTITSFKEKEKDHDKKSKTHRDREHRHRSRGKSNSGKRSRSRSRSRSHEKRHKSISHRNDRHQRSRDKETSEHNHQSDGVKQDKDEKKTYHHDKSHSYRSILDQENERNQSGEDHQLEERHDVKVVEKNVINNTANKKLVNSSRTATNKEQQSEKAEKLESCNLIDKILQSVKTVEEAANLVKSKEPDMIHGEQTEKNENHCTKSQNATALWKGEINMVDVACFNVTLHHISGNTEKLGKFFCESSEQFGIRTGMQKIEVVGRISRDTVWEYVAKIKKSPTKEIAIVSLSPSGESEKEDYKKLYDYLDIRQRLGVIGVACEHIRDFYIYPLGALKKIPVVLQTTESLEFCEDSQRSDILIGIIIRCITTRAGHLSSANLHHGIISSSSSTSKLPKLSHKLRDTNSYISKRRRISHSSKDDDIDIDAIIKTPIVSKSQRVIDTSLIVPKNDGDEPYSPGDSSDYDVLMLPSSASGGDKDEFKRKVEEINKQIAAQKKEIAGLLNVESSNLKMHTTSTSVLPNNISIPPIISTIFASIKDKSDFNRETPKLSAHEEYNPEDAIVSCSTYGKVKVDDNAASSLSHNSRLAQLSEAELLSMVPDDLIAQSTLANDSEEPPPPGV